MVLAVEYRPLAGYRRGRAGGFSASATSVEQEGLRLPPVKLFKKGVMDEEIYAIICSNIRVADQRIGDVKAQAAALDVGADRLDLLLGRYGDETVAEAITELRRRASAQMRQMITSMPEEAGNRWPMSTATAWLTSRSRSGSASPGSMTGCALISPGRARPAAGR